MQVQHCPAHCHEEKEFTMAFFRSLFNPNRARREDIARYVDIEYRGADRDAAYERMLKEAGL